MSPIVALRNLWHRRLHPRDYAALAMLVITITSFVGVWVQYNHAQRALAVATESRNTLRLDRKTTEFRFCQAINRSREINNRDRVTLERALRQSRAALRVVNDPVLRKIIVAGIVSTRQDIKDRPLLMPLHCVHLIQHPGKAPPSLRTTSTIG